MPFSRSPSPRQLDAADLSGSPGSVDPAPDVFCALAAPQTQGLICHPSPAPSSVKVKTASMATALPSTTPTRLGDQARPPPSMAVNGDDPDTMQWPTPAQFHYPNTHMPQDGVAYRHNIKNMPGPFSSNTSEPYAFTHAQNGSSYTHNVHLHYSTIQPPSPACPRFAAHDMPITSLQSPMNFVTEAYPPAAYQLEAQKGADIDISDAGISSSLLQMNEEYEHAYGPHVKLEEPHSQYIQPYCASACSEYGRASTPMNACAPRCRTGDFDDDSSMSIDKEQPYAQLIYQALFYAPGNTMVLRDIYEWFRKNTDKAAGSETKGWQNSIRHNLSMNGAFEKVDHPSSSSEHSDSRKGFMWRLTEKAIREGVKSTTRYRSKQPNKRASRNHHPQPQRQASGAKGGAAARRAAKIRRRGLGIGRVGGYGGPDSTMSRNVLSAFEPAYMRDPRSSNALYSPGMPGSPAGSTSGYYSSDIDVDADFSPQASSYALVPPKMNFDPALHSPLLSPLSATPWGNARPWPPSTNDNEAIPNVHPITTPTSRLLPTEILPGRSPADHCSLPVTDASSILDHSSEPLFTDSPSPSVDEPRTPGSLGWDDGLELDFGMGVDSFLGVNTAVEDGAGMRVLREYAG